MKKAILAAAVSLLLLLRCPPVAMADVTFPDPAPLEVGQTLNHLAASLEPGSSVFVAAGSLPPGVELTLDEQLDTTNVYLRGIPTSAGDFDAVLSVNDERSFLLSVDVRPETPKVIAGPNVSCYAGENVHVSVTASTSDGGTLSYQWYAGSSSAYSTRIDHATDAFYEPGTAYTGTTHYYCEVTNTNNGIQATAVSPVISVTVNERQATDLRVQTLPAKTAYSVGDTLDTSGLTLLLSYTDGSSETVSDGYQVSPILLGSPGTQSIELSYHGLSCRFDVSVSEAPEVIEGIGVLTLPYRTSYVVGETLDTRGLSVRAYLNRGTRDISEGLLCEPSYLGQEGSQTITVHYGEHSCTFTVTVESEERPDYLSLYQLPDKLSYQVGDSVDTRGLVLYLVSNHNNVTPITEGYSYTPSRLESAGQQTITVSYAGFTVNYTVKVSTAPASPSPSPSPTVPPAVPTPTASGAPAASPFPAVPTPAPQSERSIGDHRSFVGVIVAASAAALAAIGAYVFIMNRGGASLPEEKPEKFFRRKK